MITGPAIIVIARLALPLPPKPSMTVAVNVVGPPAVVGVPDITPVVLSAKPEGRLPDVTVQVNGTTPPETARV